MSTSYCFYYKNCQSKIPEKVEFEKEDLDILEKFSKI